MYAFSSVNMRIIVYLASSLGEHAYAYFSKLRAKTAANDDTAHTKRRSLNKCGDNPTWYGEKLSAGNSLSFLS